jgi:hypothetical protein
MQANEGWRTEVNVYQSEVKWSVSLTGKKSSTGWGAGLQLDVKKKNRKLSSSHPGGALGPTWM